MDKIKFPTLVFEEFITIALNENDLLYWNSNDLKYNRAFKHIIDSNLNFYKVDSISKVEKVWKHPNMNYDLLWKTIEFVFNPVFKVKIIFSDETERLTIGQVKSMLLESIETHYDFWSCGRDAQKLTSRIEKASNIKQIIHAITYAGL